MKLRQGVAADRRVSIEDEDMRHGRKSQSKLFNGYKEHVAIDIDDGVILACAVTPANLSETEAAPELKAGVEAQGFTISELSIDRGYLASGIVDELEAEGGEVVCKPWPAQNAQGLFTKNDFVIEMKSLRITCPAGEKRRVVPGEVVKFGDACTSCSLRERCTTSLAGRTVKVAIDEKRHQQLRRAQRTGAGRRRLRERTSVEHRQAHLAARKGHRARFRGTRKNTFDLRRVAAVENLITAQRLITLASTCSVF
jgi:IS5 family transposase